MFIFKHTYLYNLFEGGDFNGGLEQHAMDVTVNITGEIGLGTMTMNKCNGLTGWMGNQMILTAKTAWPTLRIKIPLEMESGIGMTGHAAILQDTSVKSQPMNNLTAFKMISKIDYIIINLLFDFLFVNCTDY